MVSACHLLIWWGNIVQLINLLDDRKAGVGVEDVSNLIFYDDSVTLLTYKGSLGEAATEVMFGIQNISILKIRGVVEVCSE